MGVNCHPESKAILHCIRHRNATELQGTHIHDKTPLFPVEPVLASLQFVANTMLLKAPYEF